MNWIYLTVCGFCLLPCSGIGQNLVPNPGFEDHLGCPDHSGQITNAVSWMNPNLKSPDLYHTCVGPSCEDPPFVCVPENWVGSQLPFAGVAYAGIFVGGGNPNREYLQTPLLSKLEPGESYALSYHLSLADGYAHAIDRLGAHLSVEPVFADGLLEVMPQSVSPAELFLSDKETWMKISDTIIAAGGEAFLTIGNFNDESGTRFMAGLGGDRASAYYYIDAISLTAVTDRAPPDEEKDPETGPEAETDPEDLKETTCNIFLPNAFSPNADGINDSFHLFSNCDFESLELRILNRWGDQVFSARQAHHSWNGKFRGQYAAQGVYLYFLRYTLDGKSFEKAGSFTLLY